jgi:N-acyl-D-aspartate/D-glutamate deacylase
MGLGLPVLTGIDANGLIVAPGFVDLHTHYDAQVYWDPYCSISGWHGVTSVAIGNCGFGFAPCAPKDRDRSMLSLTRNEAIPYEPMKLGMLWDWETFPQYLNSLERRGLLRRLLVRYRLSLVASTLAFTGNTYLNSDYAKSLLPEQYYARFVE